MRPRFEQGTGGENLDLDRHDVSNRYALDHSVRVPRSAGTIARRIDFAMRSEPVAHFTSSRALNSRARSRETVRSVLFASLRRTLRLPPGSVVTSLIHDVLTIVLR
jgi:hypothetical protein